MHILFDEMVNINIILGNEYEQPLSFTKPTLINIDLPNANERYEQKMSCGK